MATQGLLAITRNSKTVCKVVAGSDGNGVVALADWVRGNPTHTLDELWAQANTLFSADSLVMQTSEMEFRCVGEPPRADATCTYRQNFDNPSFNPRWQCGLADCVEVVELG